MSLQPNQPGVKNPNIRRTAPRKTEVVLDEWEVSLPDDDLSAIWDTHGLDSLDVIATTMRWIKVHIDMIGQGYESIEDLQASADELAKVVRSAEDISTVRLVLSRAESKLADSFSARMQRPVPVIMQLAVSDAAEEARDLLADREEKADWEIRRLNLPLLWKHEVFKIELEKQTGAVLYREIRELRKWPEIPVPSKTQGPMITEATGWGSVRVSIWLPTEALTEFRKHGVNIADLVRCMTTWGGDRFQRSDYETAWFGRPGGYPSDSMHFRVFQWSKEGDSHPLELVTFELTADLFETVKGVSWALRVAPEAWLWGCVVAFPYDSHGVMGEDGRNRRAAKQFFNETKGGKIT